MTSGLLRFHELFEQANTDRLKWWYAEKWRDSGWRNMFNIASISESNYQHSRFCHIKSMAHYVEIAKKPPTTMTDLDMATVPSKSVDPVIWCSMVNHIPRPSSYAKIKPQMIWNSTQQHQNHHGTQLYAQPKDDPLASNHHEPCNYYAKHPWDMLATLNIMN